MRAIVLIGMTAWFAPVATAGPVSIFAEPTTTETPPGSNVSFLFLIRETELTPSFGYSFDVDIAPDAGGSGTSSAHIQPTNFFFEQDFQRVDLRDSARVPYPLRQGPIPRLRSVRIGAGTKRINETLLHVEGIEWHEA